MYRSAVIIDDSPLERFLAETIMSHTGFVKEIISYGSATEALEYLKSIGSKPDRFPDIILLDIQMPVMNGFEFLDAYANLPADLQRHCKVVMFSSTIANEDYARMKKNPAIKKFLSKPLSEEMFHDLNLS